MPKKYNIWKDDRPHDAAWKREMEYRNQNRYRQLPEFATYPDGLLYEKQWGDPLVLVPARDSLMENRQAAEEYLERIVAWNQNRLRELKRANRFAEELVKIYGDLPLYVLTMKWQAKDVPVEETKDPQIALNLG